jgi:dihydrodipicolinate synthase/N-acetylneuraminate lyase
METSEIASWRGVLPSLPTPFTEAGNVDLSAVGPIVEFAVDAGAAGVVSLGLAGEVETLAIGERLMIVERIVAAAGGRVPVLAGATAESVHASTRLASKLEEGGVDGIVLPPPVGMRLDDRELAAYFAAVAGAVEIPVVLQDAPEFLDVGMTPQVVVAARERASNIAGLKLETSAEGLDAWRRETGGVLAFFTGSGGLHMLDCLNAGAVGIMPAVDTIDLLVAVYDAWAASDHAEAEARYARVLPLLVFEMQSMPHSNRCVKHLLARRGLPITPVLRAPATQRLSEASRARLERHALATLEPAPALSGA